MPRKRAPQQGFEFNVRYPPWARSLSGGRKRLFKTFMDRRIGAAWVAQEEAKKKALRAGGEREAIGLRVFEDLTFTAASGLWLKSFDGATSTLKWYQILLRAHLVPHFGAIRCSQIGREEVQAYLDFRKQEGAKAGARAKDLTILRMVLRWAREGGHPVDNTAWKIKKPAVVPEVSRTYDPDKMTRLVAACPTDREQTILEVALMTGMRQGELRAFEVPWISWRQGVIQIPADRSFAPKSRRTRSIPLFGRLEETLKTWLHGRKDGLVFPPLRDGISGSGTNQGPYLRGIIQRAKKAAKVKLQGMHDLRHFYGSWLLHEGFNIVEVQEILGHRDVATTRRYLHLPPDFVSYARERLDRAAMSWVVPRTGGKVVGLDSRRTKGPISKISGDRL